MDENKCVVVIGGGVAGIQAALDLAEQDFKVYLVEKNSSIGGRMAQLDKTFPTNDCSICILAPKMLECFGHKNITVLSYSEVGEVSGEKGDFTVKVRKKPRYVDEEKCTGCSACEDACLLKDRFPNEFDMGLGKRGAAYLPFAQAVPRVAVIDEKNCLFITKGKCGKAPACKEACERDAIDFDQKEEEVELHVGAIIIATGLDAYEPYEIEEYGYGQIENVITGLQYERMINAGGPTGGHLVRLSDGKPAKRLAFILCVGSRDLKRYPYCSSVCCMYATKSGMLAREHEEDMESFVFYTDIRAFGRGFHEYIERGMEEYGINFVRAKPGKITENANKSLVIWYEDTLTGELKRMEADLVILATALMPSKGVEELATTLGVELDEYGFLKVKDSLYSPVDTTREGVFVCGFAQSPKDITDSVAQASGAAGRAGEVISSLS
ncbi:MAG: CoB--CoM heterodisulfide reductase iron-sulfur subunit A family protein [Halobacteriota archaeon]